MSSSDYDRIKREIDGIIHAIHRDGLSATVSNNEAKALFDATARMHRTFSAPDREVLVLQASLIWHAAQAAQESPLWLNIATLGAATDGDIWFTPMSESGKYFYGLLLTNCAIARSVCGGAFQPSIEWVASQAYNFFPQRRYAEANRWKATLNTVLAYNAFVVGNREYKLDHSRRALELMGPSPTVSAELYLFTQVLAEERQEGSITEGGFMGLRRRSRPAFFGVQDLFLFNS